MPTDPAPTALPGRALEWFAPARLGPSFRWLLGGAYAANLADGIVLAAGPLLVASLTDSALLVAAAPMMNRLPWLVLGLGVGALADRWDRRRMTIAGDLSRVVVLALLVATLLSGHATIGLVLAVMLLLGVAEVVTDSAGMTLLPSLVGRQELVLGNSRMMGTALVGNQLVGPALGAGLFALGSVWAFSTGMLLIALAAACVTRIVLPSHPATEVDDDRDGTPARRSVHADVVEGLVWLRHNPAVRTLVLTILTFNITWAMGWGVLVLWAQQRLGLGAVGFGLLTTASAVGGIIAVLAFDRLAARYALSTLMRVCLTLEVLWHLVMATATWAWVGYAALFGFGLYTFVWGSTSSAVRQRATPDHMMGRMSSINLVGLTGGMVVGMPIGGLLADAFGITAPFWVGFVGSGLTLVVIWRSLGHIAHVVEPAGPESGSAPGDAG
ncbi:Predicted arabinose efflux permease, MFS family [Kytococcus aerolatus]|uniref:Predicted arabinose efflux permease, MFS family n=1 Tax=Kytococcus aerolatus TaxID=592308 RepID=A0A212U558_9MICO|nr:MFS transporter [Kytococcus aerolatus]SNC73392.1 Predicted arabinose efflux permease, MFS family [Kytococcus aerolatus]